MTRHTFVTVFCTFDWRSEFLSHIVTKVQTLACPSSSTLLHYVLTTHPYVYSHTHSIRNCSYHNAHSRYLVSIDGTAPLLRWRHIIGALAGATYWRAQLELPTATLRRLVCPSSTRCAHHTPPHSAMSGCIRLCWESLVYGRKARAYVLPLGAGHMSIFVFFQHFCKYSELINSSCCNRPHGSINIKNTKYPT